MLDLNQDVPQTRESSVRKWLWCLMPGILAQGRPRQEDFHVFKDSLGYGVSPCLNTLPSVKPKISTGL